MHVIFAFAMFRSSLVDSAYMYPIAFKADRQPATTPHSPTRSLRAHSLKSPAAAGVLADEQVALQRHTDRNLQNMIARGRKPVLVYQKAPQAAAAE
jgi:hypothetical protein